MQVKRIVVSHQNLTNKYASKKDELRPDLYPESDISLRYKNCAVVGNSGILLDHTYGTNTEPR